MAVDPPSDEGSTFQRVPFDPSPEASAEFALVVVEGPDLGASFVVDAACAARVLVGTSEACAMRLTDREVSRRHLGLEPVGKRLRLFDLGSTNGTWVDGVSIVEAYLSGGELLRLGATALRVDAKDAASPPLPVDTSFGAVIGASTEMRRLYPLCHRFAASNVPVIIEGETGTGKEVLAESLHGMGPRASGPFVVFDCTAVPPNLLESELFGHERGAFTGAIAARKGVFEQAHKGTLLVDEIGDLDLALQPKLLRALERSEVRRVGGERFLKVDVRVLAATRRDLDREIHQGRFRDDLFHRLAVGRIELPPLRRRRGDVALLGMRFWKELGGSERALHPQLLKKWEDYAWPGNVRELRNVVARTLALGELSWSQPAAAAEENPPRGSDERADLVEHILGLRLPLTEARQRLIEEFEQRYVARVLAEHGGNVTHAAQASQIGRRHFQRLRAKKNPA
jgi:DNA-binding NtrC family response regulator